MALTSSNYSAYFSIYLRYSRRDEVGRGFMEVASLVLYIDNASPSHPIV